MKVTALYCYPIKSLRGIQLETGHAARTGFPHDRRFMLQKVVAPEDKGDGAPQETKYRNMSVSGTGRTALFHQEFRSGPDGQVLRVVFREPQAGTEEELEVPLEPSVDELEQHDIDLHKWETKAYKMGPKYDQWFSKHFGYDVILVYIGPHHRTVRGNVNPSADKPVGWSLSMLKQVPVVGSYLAGTSAEIDFSDLAAYLVTTEESLANVSSRLPDGESMDMRKFRPNIVLSGSPAEWDEDFWAEIQVRSAKTDEDTSIVFTANCGRCNSINVDFQTGKNGTGPSGRILTTLRKDRCVDPGQKYAPIFGRYGFLTSDVLARGGGDICVGDEVTVTRRNTERTVLDM